MPFVLCKIHRGNGAPHGCRHITDKVWANQHPGNATFVDLDGFFFNGWMCDACLDLLNSHGLQEYLARYKGFANEPPADELDPLVNLVDLQPMCGKCFNELTGLTKAS